MKLRELKWREKKRRFFYLFDVADDAFVLELVAVLISDMKNYRGRGEINDIRLIAPRRQNGGC